MGKKHPPFEAKVENLPVEVHPQCSFTQRDWYCNTRWGATEVVFWPHFLHWIQFQFTSKLHAFKCLVAMIFSPMPPFFCLFGLVRRLDLSTTWWLGFHCRIRWLWGPDLCSRRVSDSASVELALWAFVVMFVFSRSSPGKLPVCGLRIFEARKIPKTIRAQKWESSKK